MAPSRCSLLLLLFVSAALTQVDCQVVLAPTPAAGPCTNAFQELAPCLDFASGVVPEPPQECCTGLKDVAQNDAPCLCELINNPDKYKINSTLALELPKKCGLTIPVDNCQQLAPVPATLPPPTPAPGSPTPPPPPAPPVFVVPPPQGAPAPAPSAASSLKVIPFGIVTILATVALL